MVLNLSTFLSMLGRYYRQGELPVRFSTRLAFLRMGTGRLLVLAGERLQLKGSMRLKWHSCRGSCLTSRSSLCYSSSIVNFWTADRQLCSLFSLFIFRLVELPPLCYQPSPNIYCYKVVRQICYRPGQTYYYSYCSVFLRVGCRLMRLRQVGCSPAGVAAFGTLEGDYCFLRGGEAVISCSFRFFSLINSSITSRISSWHNAETRKLAVMGVGDAFSVILMPKNRSKPADGRMANWSMQDMISTEVILSCPELLMELERVITVWKKSMMLVMPMAQFSNISPLLLEVHPYRSLASSKFLSGSDEMAGMASILTVSIYISDSPWFFIAFSPCFLVFCVASAYETFRKFTFFSSISKMRKMRGSRKRLKVTGQRMMRLICKHVTAKAPINISSFSRYFLSSLKQPPTSVYFFSQDTATVLFTFTLCRHPSSCYLTIVCLLSERLDFLSSRATPAAMRMQRTEMSILSGSTPSLIQRLIIYNNNKICHYPQDTMFPTFPAMKQCPMRVVISYNSFWRNYILILQWSD